MSNRVLRCIALFCCVVILGSFGGVYATWLYAQANADSIEANVDSDLVEFVWKPENLLPTESQIGENHLALIDLIMNEKSKGYGLNYDKKNVLESYLNDEGYIFSNQKTSGGNVKFVSDDTNQLYYCIEKVTDTMYYAYTFAYSELAAAGGTSSTITVYRTVLEKTDKWRAPRSYLGYAPTIKLSDMGASNMSGTLRYSIDFREWTAASYH